MILDYSTHNELYSDAMELQQIMNVLVLKNLIQCQIKVQNIKIPHNLN